MRSQEFNLSRKRKFASARAPTRRENENSRGRLSNEEKLEICQSKEANPNSSVNEIMDFIEERFGFRAGRSSIYKILNAHDDLLKMSTSELQGASAKGAVFPELENELIKFIFDMEKSHTAINSLSVSTKAEILINQRPELLNGHERPQFSKGWIYRFMHRHNLKNRLMNGEAGSAEVDTADVQNELKEVKEALRGYEPRDIYNMDETGLYYRSAPTRTLSQKPVSGVKVDKTRMSVAFFLQR